MASIVTSMLLLITLSAMAFAQGKPGKPGTCPPTGSVGICADICSIDQDCVGNQKCCKTACGGTTCLVPVTAPVNVVKGGSCPARPTGRWTCSSTCRADGDCRGNKKCCRNRCGALACQNAVFQNPGDDDNASPPVLAFHNTD